MAIMVESIAVWRWIEERSEEGKEEMRVEGSRQHREGSVGRMAMEGRGLDLVRMGGVMVAFAEEREERSPAEEKWEGEGEVIGREGIVRGGDTYVHVDARDRARHMVFAAA